MNKNVSEPAAKSTEVLNFIGWFAGKSFMGKPIIFLYIKNSNYYRATCPDSRFDKLPFDFPSLIQQTAPPQQEIGFEEGLIQRCDFWAECEVSTFRGDRHWKRYTFLLCVDRTADRKPF